MIRAVCFFVCLFLIFLSVCLCNPEDEILQVKAYLTSSIHHVLNYFSLCETLGVIRCVDLSVAQDCHRATVTHSKAPVNPDIINIM